MKHRQENLRGPRKPTCEALRRKDLGRHDFRDS